MRYHFYCGFLRPLYNKLACWSLSNSNSYCFLLGNAPRTLSVPLCPNCNYHICDKRSSLSHKSINYCSKKAYSIHPTHSVIGFTVTNALTYYNKLNIVSVKHFTLQVQTPDQPTVWSSSFWPSVIYNYKKYQWTVL